MLYPFFSYFHLLYSFIVLLNKYAQEGIKKRILIINVSERPIISYMNFMNSIFYYKTECPIDICQVYYEPDSFLKQASTLTKGSYVRVKSSKSLYGLLSYYFLPDLTTRKNMVYKHEKLEPMEVRCSCHGNKIPNDRAYVCSVCLAILCQYSEKCPLHEMDCNCLLNEQTNIISKFTSILFLHNFIMFIRIFILFFLNSNSLRCLFIILSILSSYFLMKSTFNL